MKNRASYNRINNFQPKSPAQSKNSQQEKQVSLKQSFIQSNPFMNKKIKSQVFQLIRQQRQKQMQQVPMVLMNLKSIFMSKQIKQENVQAYKRQSSTSITKRNSSMQCIPIYRKIQFRKRQSVRQSNQRWEEDFVQKKQNQIIYQNFQPFHQRQRIVNQIKPTTRKGRRINYCCSSSNFMALTERKTSRTPPANKTKKLNQPYFQTKKHIQSPFAQYFEQKIENNYFSLKRNEEVGSLQLRIAGNKAPSSQTGSPWKRNLSNEISGNKMRIKFVK